MRPWIADQADGNRPIRHDTQYDIHALLFPITPAGEGAALHVCHVSTCLIGFRYARSTRSHASSSVSHTIASDSASKGDTR
jgi:hypothetical protein